MTINFRRNALQLSVAALFSSAFMANAANVPQVKVTVTDKQCEPIVLIHLKYEKNREDIGLFGIWRD